MNERVQEERKEALITYFPQAKNYNEQK